MTDKQLREKLRKIIQQEYHNYRIEEGIVNWMIDKVGQFGTNLLKSKTEYTLARIYKDPEFRKLSKQFGMKEDEFVQRATKLIKQDPKKFADILAYDVRKGAFGKYFK